jgi:hypothetical protein
MWWLASFSDVCALRLLLQQVWSGVCRETTAMARAWTTTLGSDAREAKERLDHKLRSQRQLGRVQFQNRIGVAESALVATVFLPEHCSSFCFLV